MTLNLGRPDEGFDVVRRQLIKFFAAPPVDLIIGVLILISVSLTLAELALPESAESLASVTNVNYAITILFAVELSLRFVAESRQAHPVRTYARRWWIDVLAVFPALIFPVLEALKLVRSFQILRFLRVLRVARLYRASMSFLPYVIRRGAVHIGLVVLALFASVALGTALILSFEKSPDFNFDDAFWFALYSLFAGEPIPQAPTTIGGRIASIAILFLGLLVFATLIGTVSAYVIDRLREEGRGMGKGDVYEDHVILVGLGTVGYRVAEALQRMNQKVVIIDNEEDSDLHVWVRAHHKPLIVEDVRKPGVLEQAGIKHCKAVIACTSSDLTNLEIALDARHERPDVRVVMRVFDHRLAEKIAEGFNIQVALSASSLAAPALAAAAIDRSVRGSLDVSGELFIQSEFRVPGDSELAGKTVGDLRGEYDVHTLVIKHEQADWVWAPRSHRVIPGDTLISLLGPYDKVEKLKEACGVTQDLVRALASVS